MTLVLPGVELKVVKDIVVGQLNPSGVLGLVGMASTDGTQNVIRVKGYSELVSKLGGSVAFSLPEARQALSNGVGQIVLVPVRSSSAAPATAEVPLAKGAGTILVKARGAGLWGNRISIRVQQRPDENGNMTKVRMNVRIGSEEEVYDNTSLAADDPRNLVGMVNTTSSMVELSLKDAVQHSKPTVEEGKQKAKKETATTRMVPSEGTFDMTGGKGASPGEYTDAIALLESEDDVDIVVASIEDHSNEELVKGVHSALEAHCQIMSKVCMNRIALGSIPPPTVFRDVDEEVEFALRQTNTMCSDRFVLVAPHGALGAVAGLVGRLDVHESPTFKNLTGVASLSRRYSPTQLEQFLKANILALEERRGRGIMVEKGILTSGEQISVQRVADKAVRGVKMIGDRFLGTLNNSKGRSALKEKITEFFIQMEKDGAIVPSSDGSDPAYKVDVYATDDDISKGIVRCDVAVRPVRAIDYVYGTIFVRS